MLLLRWFFPQLLSLLGLAMVLQGCAATSELSTGDRERVAGKTYVITGASSGFGRGVAVKLGELKANVVLAARRVEVLQEVAAQIEAAGGQALVVPTDVSEVEAVERLAAQAIARFGRIDVWINNAGVAVLGVFDEIPVQHHARVIDVNLKGTIYGSHAALRQFRAQGQGVLVNVASLESELPVAYHASYAASKAAILSLGRTFTEELRLQGLDNIQVATVLPWGANTPFFENAGNYTGREGCMVYLDDPYKVVNAILWASLHPQEEVVVGWKAKGGYFLHRLMPDLTEWATANIYQDALLDHPVPEPANTGNLYQPPATAAGIEGNAACLER